MIYGRKVVKEFCNHLLFNFSYENSFFSKNPIYFTTIIAGCFAIVLLLGGCAANVST